MTTLNEFLEEVVHRLSPEGHIQESPLGFKLKCPNPECLGENFFILKTNGCGTCLNELFPTVGGYRQYSPWETARLLGLDVYGLYGLFTEPTSVTSFATNAGTTSDRLRGLRTDSTEPDKLAKSLLAEPSLMDRYLMLAKSCGIVGEEDLLRTMNLIVTSRKVKKRRIHSNIREQSAARQNRRTCRAAVPRLDEDRVDGGCRQRRYVDLRMSFRPSGEQVR